MKHFSFLFTLLIVSIFFLYNAKDSIGFDMQAARATSPLLMAQTDGIKVLNDLEDDDDEDMDDDELDEDMDDDDMDDYDDSTMDEGDEAEELEAGSVDSGAELDEDLAHDKDSETTSYECPDKILFFVDSQGITPGTYEIESGGTVEIVNSMNKACRINFNGSAYIIPGRQTGTIMVPQVNRFTNLKMEVFIANTKGPIIRKAWIKVSEHTMRICP